MSSSYIYEIRLGFIRYMSNCVFILQLFLTSPSRLLLIVSTDFLALRLFCFNIRQHGRQILYFKLHVDGHKFHYRRPHATVRPQVVHRCYSHCLATMAFIPDIYLWINHNYVD